MSEKKAICYFCGKPCDKGDFCHGCQQYICSDCDETGVMGNHEPEEHVAVTLKPFPKAKYSENKTPEDSVIDAYYETQKWRGDTAQKLREIVENLPKYPDDVGGMYPYEIQMYSADVEKVFAKVKELLEALEK